jgi:hypothetical protein
MKEVEVPPRSAGVSIKDGAHNELVMMKYLWPTLNYGQIAGRIYYTSVCPPGVFPLLFPKLNVQPPSKGQVGISAARDIFRHEPRVSVMESASGIIRMKIGTISEELLLARIPSLTLSPTEQYNYAMAISEIQDAPPVLSAMRRLNLQPLLRTFDMAVVEPAEGLPHLPSVLTNITMDQALDLVAETFHGVVLYEMCASGDRYDISFIDDRSYIPGLKE